MYIGVHYGRLPKGYLFEKGLSKRLQIDSTPGNTK